MQGGKSRKRGRVLVSIWLFGKLQQSVLVCCKVLFCDNLLANNVLQGLFQASYWETTVSRILLCGCGGITVYRFQRIHLRIAAPFFDGMRLFAANS